jgi:hypothetical protein
VGARMKRYKVWVCELMEMDDGEELSAHDSQNMDVVVKLSDVEAERRRLDQNAAALVRAVFHD